MVPVLVRIREPLAVCTAISLRDNYQVLGIDEVQESRRVSADDYLGGCLLHNVNQMLN